MLLRPAEPDDAAAVARVHVCSWQIAYRGLLPEEYLDALAPEDRAPHYPFGDRAPGRPPTPLAPEDREPHYPFGDREPGRPLTTVALERDEICGFVTAGPSRDGDRPDSG